MGFTVDRTIPRPVEDVWRIMTDWKIAEYWLGVNRLRPADAERAPRAGAKLSCMVRGPPQAMEITAWQQRQRLGLASRQGGIVVTYDYELTDNTTGTRVQLTSSCVGDNWFWRGFVPLLEWMMRVADRKQLQALENLVRATTGSGT